MVVQAEKSKGIERRPAANAGYQKPGKGITHHPFFDNRAEAAVQARLQDAAKSHSLAKQLKTFPEKNGFSLQPPVQGVFINKGLDDDTAYQRVYSFLVSRGDDGTILEPGAKATLTATNPGEPINILLHGGKPTEKTESSVLFWTPEQLLEKLEASGFEAAKHTGKITLLACHAGYSLDGKAPAFAAKFAKLLREKGYKGDVLAVEGSVQPPQTGKEDPLSPSAKLWQSDPADGHLMDLSAAYSAGAEPVFDAQDYLYGDKDEPNAGDAVGIALNYLISVLTALERYQDICLKNLEGFEDFQPRLKEWIVKVGDQLQIVNDLIKGQKGKAATGLPNAEELGDALTQLRSDLSDELSELQKDYRKARVEKSGYVQGITDLFKPLAFEKF